MPQQDNNPNIQLPYQNIDDMIEATPNWLLRSGISMVALVSLVLLLLANFIKYPDKIVSRGILTSQTPPVEVKSKAKGIIEKIYVEKDAFVEVGDSILYIQNTSVPKDITQLESFFKDYQQTTNKNELLKLKVPKNLALGVLQDDYARLILQFNEARSMADQSDIYQQVDKIKKEIQHLENWNVSMEAEKTIFEEELVLVQKEFDRSKSLEAEGVISTQERENTQVKLLQYEQKRKNMASRIIQNNIQMEQLRLRQLQLKEERKRDISSYTFTIAETISRLKSQMSQWKDAYVLIAPQAGKLNLHSNITENKVLQQDESIGFIINKKDSASIYIKTFALASGIGKVALGDRTIIKFDGYPYKEYGTLNCPVAYISPLPEQDEQGNAIYEINLALNRYPIQTNYQKIIPFQPNTTLTAEIITDNQSILTRIFHQFVSLLSETQIENNTN